MNYFAQRRPTNDGYRCNVKKLTLNAFSIHNQAVQSKMTFYSGHETKFHFYVTMFIPIYIVLTILYFL